MFKFDSHNVTVMATSVRAEIRIDDPPTCQLAAVSRETSSVQSITRSGTPVDESVTEEFTVGSTVELDEMEEVFAHESGHVYRFSREQGQGCACELVESYDIPIQSIRADDGTLIIAFYAPDMDVLRDLIMEMRSEIDGVSLRRLTRSEGPDADESLVFVDRNDLTDRQREILETAHEMGYFDHPKAANATEVSEALDINRSTFAEHLAAAQSTLLDTVLDA